MDIVLSISAILTLISTSVGIWITALQYRLKVKAELRLKQSAEAESDIRLLTLFTQLMSIANGRSGYIGSEKFIELLWDERKEAFPQMQQSDIESIINDIRVTGVLTLPVGHAAQMASIKAIEILACKYPILADVGIEALKALEKSNIQGLSENNSSRICRIESAMKQHHLSIR